MHRTNHGCWRRRYSTPWPGQAQRAPADQREFTGEDLRLSPTQAGAVLNDRLGLGMSQVEIETVLEATDGWVTGVRLLASHGSTGHGPARGAGPQRLYDYLVEEILTREPVEAQELLLATCVLDEVTPAVAQRLTARGDAGEILAGVQRRNHLLVHRAGAVHARSESQPTPTGGGGARSGAVC